MAQLSSDHHPALLALVSLLIAFAASAPTSAQQASTQQKTVGGVLSGNLSAPGGAILEYPLVFLFDADSTGNVLDLATPNADGDYRFKGLDTGEYKVSFSGRQGIRSYYEFYDQAVDLENATRIAVVDGQITSGIDGVLGLAPGGTVSGRVVDPYGRGFDTLTVTAFENDGNSWVETEYSAQNLDRKGNYSLDLPAGTFRMRFEVASYLAPNGASISEFWPDATAPENALDVVVGIDTLQRDVDGVVGETAPGSLGGTVTDDQGLPVAGVEVRVAAVRSGELYDEWSVTDGAGAFRVENLWPDDFTLEFFDPLGRYEWTYFGGLTAGGAPAVQIPVGLGPITGVDISLEDDDPTTPGGSISGLVTSSDGQPLRLVRVSSDPSCDHVYAACESSRSTFTDANGFYRLRPLPSDQVVVQFSDWDGFAIGEWYLDAEDEDSATPVTVASPFSTGGINAELELGGAIEGRVLNDNGLPFGIYFVTAYGFIDGEWVPVGSDADINDGQGFYRIANLPPGDYRVLLSGGSLGSTHYQNEWYDDAFSVESADDVTVSAGITTGGIDAVLGNEPPGALSGTVTDTSGNAIEEATVWVYGPNLLDILATAQTAPDGTYTVTGLRPGRVYVKFVAGADREYWQDVADASLATPVEVELSEILGIDAELGATSDVPGGGSISGTVRDANGSPLPDISVTCFPAGFADSVPICNTTTGADGSYVLGGNLPSGDYWVQFAPLDVYVRELYDDTLFFEEAQDIAVTVGFATSGIDAVLDQAGAVEGTLSSAGDDLTLAWVEGYLQNSSGAWRFVAAATADAETGAYRLDGLRPDTYRLRFVGLSADGLQAEVYADAMTVETGNDVMVTAGSTTSGIDATLGDLGMLRNPGFDDTLESWSFAMDNSSMSPAFDASADRLVHGDGGALRIDADDLDGGIGGGEVAQCVNVGVSEGTALRAGGFARLSNELSVASLRLEIYPDPACAGQPLDTVSLATTLDSERTAGVWQALEGSVSVPPGTTSVRLEVELMDLETGDSVWLDDLYLAREATLFVDGFESGSVDAWQ